ncbi:MAG TPA: polymer-forming cytoskeletal protein [Pyrinomonadaceae bacterium]|nr:polymer-forming cytoskeletal protein [Pyrinomonadaceae bacterium]
MLRMGKNSNEEKSQSQSQSQSQPDTDYANRSYSPYQNNDSYRPSPDSTATPKALTESETIAREIKDGSLSGFVGSGTVITGEASFKSMLRVDGRFSGRIISTGGTLIVGSGGQVDANIEVCVATIHGIVNGDIIASDRIELGRAAKLTGNIQTPALMIEQGAVFEGSCKMVQQKATADKPPKVERKENVLDASKLDAVRVDAPKKPEDISKPAVTAALS